MVTAVGRKAPDFTGKLATGTEVKDFRLGEQLGHGPVVLAFFPAAFTSTCQVELCEFRDLMAEFNGVHARVFGVSVDLPWSLNQFKRENNLNFDLVSDWTSAGTAAFGVGASLRGVPVSGRAVFVLDKEGVVRWIWRTETLGDKPDVVAVAKEAARVV